MPKQTPRTWSISTEGYFPKGGIVLKLDKKMHLLSGFSITVLVGLLLKVFLSFSWGYIIGLTTAIVFGAFKEYVYDYKLKRGTPEVKDFLFTILGGFIAYTILKWM
jgi:hypothetical protein